MKLNKKEKIALLITLCFVLVSRGFLMGRVNSPTGDFTISALAVSAVQKSPQPVKSESSTANKTDPVNINTADKEALMTLNGIGEVLAQRIIDYRQQNGNFGKIEDLTNVRGIGSGILEKNRDIMTID